MHNKILVWSLVLLLSSCSLFENRRDRKIARVNNKYLYERDITGLIPAGTSAADSTVIIKRYIDSWIRQQLMVQQAEKNLPANQLDFQRRLDDYRNSLVIFAYETQLLTQNLDTLITDNQIAEYFEKHSGDFRLRDHIVQINYVKVPVDAPELNVLRRLFRSNDEQDMLRLEEYCLNHAVMYILNQDSWILFSDILRDIPIQATNPETYLRSNRFVELSDEVYRYFVHFRDFKLKDGVSPMAFERENIRSILINHRKQLYINEFRQNLYREAATNQQFEVF